MIGLLIFMGIVAVAVYNGLVALRNQFKNAFSQIDVQLQRRYDLIPNLVETAKGYMKHERETLEAVIQARNQAANAARAVEADPTNAMAMRELGGAENALSGMLSRFFALSEAYPDLKANQTMMQLQEALSSTENKIAFARQAYNDAVMHYNNKRESFPDSLIAGSFSFTAAQLLELEEEAARKPVKVSF